MGFSYLTGLFQSQQGARGIRTAATAVGGLGAAYYLGKNIYRDYQKGWGYRSRHYPKADPRSYAQYNRQLSGRRRFRVGQRIYRGRRQRGRYPRRFQRWGKRPGYFSAKPYIAIRGRNNKQLYWDSNVGNYRGRRLHNVWRKERGGGAFTLRPHAEWHRQGDTYTHGRHY